MYFQKGKKIDYDNIPFKASIDGDPNPKTTEEIQAYLTKTIKIDIDIPEGTYKLSDLLSDKLLEIKQGA